MIVPLLLTLAALAGGPATSPRIEVYTMGQGERIFERYGHAAICVIDDRRPFRSRCYNFGTIDFSKPLDLSWKFLQGKAKFFVSVWRPRRMVMIYAAHDRTIYRQRLDLKPEQVRAIATRLDEIYRDPEQRYYVYHHFFDNCSTRIRDVIDEQLGGALKNAPDAQELTDKTYRTLGREGLADDSGLHTTLIAVSDFMVGSALDRRPTRYELTFLPRALRDQLKAKLGAEPELLHERKGPAFRSDGSTGRHWVVLLALLAAVPVAAAHRFGRFLRLSMAPGTVFLSLIAFLVYGLAAITTVPELAWNEAFFVFLPTDAVVPFLPEKYRRYYAQGRLGLLVLVALLLAVGVFRQPLWVPMLVPALFFGATLTPCAPTAPKKDSTGDDAAEGPELDRDESAGEAA